VVGVGMGFSGTDIQVTRGVERDGVGMGSDGVLAGSGGDVCDDFAQCCFRGVKAGHKG
jgi:hypothetical protein